MKRTVFWLATPVALAFSLAGCGGGGGSGAAGLASTPPPPLIPPTTLAVSIFPSPTPGEFASVGVSTNDDLVARDDRLSTLSNADVDQPHIRYNSGGFYEIELPGSSWDRLVHYKGLANPTSGNNYFQPASRPQNLGYLLTSGPKSAGYSYSELAAWGNVNLTAEDGFGFVAFGTPTPAGAVPVTGSATYNGIVSGTADVLEPDFLVGGYFPTPVEGTVSLKFDFGAATLAGSTTLYLNMGMNPLSIGTFDFIETVFSSGSTTYSGKFDTDVGGKNFFLGRFTGPNATETIGAWALPFVYSGDHEAHQAIGAWIAKQH